jgi:hypothetical protein
MGSFSHGARRRLFRLPLAIGDQTAISDGHLS